MQEETAFTQLPFEFSRTGDENLLDTSDVK